MKKMSKLEAVLWNIAFPGFSQVLMGHYIKGILFVVLEVMINAKSYFNMAIMYSFLGEINKAEVVLNYQWLMFYPCVYMFSMWDGYRSAMPEEEKYTFLPFVFGAFFVTVGLMLSPKVTILELHPGPVFLPLMFLIPGLLTGFVFKFLMSLKLRNKIE